MVLALSLQACQSARKPLDKPEPPPKFVFFNRPLVDFARGAGGFPLAHKGVPQNRDELTQSMTSAYKARVSLPSEETAVQATGEYPALEELRVDLSGASIRANYRPTQMKQAVAVRDGLTVRKLEYVASPIRYGGASSYVRVEARDVKMGLITDRRERGVLVLTEARDGTAALHMSREDVRQALITTARAAAGKAGFLVTNLKLELKSDSSRSLAATVKLDGLWVLLPASLTFTGRIDVDDRFNARFSSLAVEGNDVTGSVIAGVLKPKLQKYNHKAMPLVHFPDGKIRLQDLRIQLDDELDVTVAFGSVPRSQDMMASGAE